MTEKDDEISREVTLKLRDYVKFKENIKTFNLDEYVRSPTFEIVAGGVVTKWFFRFYSCPVEKSSDLLKFVLCQPRLRGEKILCDIKWTLLLADDSKKVFNFSKDAKNKLITFGYEDFVVDGNFMFKSLITFSKWVIESVPVTGSLDKIFVSNFKMMLEDQSQLADFELKTKDNETLKAHRSIIAARSPVFFKMLTSDMEEAKQGWANVPDFDSIVMKEVLRFIYCNEVRDLNKIDYDLIFAAEKYQLDELKEICIDSMIAQLSSENVLKFAVIADHISKASKLFNSCVDWINRHYHDVVATPEFTRMPQDIALKICLQLNSILKEKISFEL